MHRIFLILFIILISYWTVDNYRINSSGSVYTAPIEKNKIPETPIVSVTDTATTTPVIATTTEKAVVKATSTPEKKPIKKQSVVVKPTETPMLPIPTPEPITDYEAINAFTRKAVVNILCTARTNDLNPISGTGVIISSSGVVLTNAHVAQYVLLRNLYQRDFINCILRTGSPAYPKYKVELAWISPLWVNENKAILKSQNPKGTGENDFAFLRITGMVDDSALPTQSGVLSLPYVPTNTSENLMRNNPVVLVSYPAGFLGGQSIIQDLSLTSGITLIKDMFTLKENTVDLISVSGTVVSQKGSSGGAVVDKNSTLVGIISTSSDGDTTSERSLNAITLGYINRSLKNETGLTLSEFLSQDVATYAKTFQNTTAIELVRTIREALTPQ